MNKKSVTPEHDPWAIDEEYEGKVLADIRAAQTFFMYLKGGDNEVRILPRSSVDVRTWHMPYFMHFGVSADNSPLYCPHANWGVQCHVCDQIAILRESDDEREHKKADTIKLVKREFVNAVDMKRLDAGVQLLQLPVSVLELILSFIFNPKWGNILHPQTGRIITISKSGSGMKTKYGVQPDPVPTALQDMKWLTSMQKLQEVVPRVSYATSREVYTGEQEEMGKTHNGSTQDDTTNQGHTADAEDSSEGFNRKSDSAHHTCPKGTFGKFTAADPKCLTCDTGIMNACINSLRQV